MEPPSADAAPVPVRSLFLFADSQLLFWKDGGALFLERVRAELGPGSPRAAYLGASNGDVPDYYDIFVAGMEGIGVRACRMIPSAPSPDDRAFLDDAQVILLAGGDAERGLRVFHDNGLAERILARYAAGAVLIGISAGAVQLGQRLPGATGAEVQAFQLAPMVVATHDEPEWAALGEVVTALEGTVRGVGIPAGAGAVVHADLTVEPVRRTLVELSVEEGRLRRAALMPESGEKGSEGARGLGPLAPPSSKR
jgi:Peptidase family S51